MGSINVKIENAELKHVKQDKKNVRKTSVLTHIFKENKLKRKGKVTSKDGKNVFEKGKKKRKYLENF